MKSRHAVPDTASTRTKLRREQWIHAHLAWAFVWCCGSSWRGRLMCSTRDKCFVINKVLPTAARSFSEHARRTQFFEDDCKKGLLIESCSCKAMAIAATTKETMETKNNKKQGQRALGWNWPFCALLPLGFQDVGQGNDGTKNGLELRNSVRPMQSRGSAFTAQKHLVLGVAQSFTQL